MNPLTICQRYSFRDGHTIILCHEGFPSPATMEGKGCYPCPELEGCLVRWSRAQEQYNYQLNQGK